jgi:methionyl aminopeptidase
MQTKVKTRTEIESMRVGGKMLATVLQALQPRIAPGMTTKDIALVAAAELKPLGGKPSFLGYQGFPDVICISVNDEVVHGIPSKHRVIEDGDMIGLDFGVTYGGMITDAAVSLIAGKPKQRGHVQLLKDTEEAMYIGIKAVKAGGRTGDVGAAVEEFLKRRPYGIVKDLVGHGVGHEIHEDPNIPNFGRPDTGPWLQKGMTIAIEPMVTLGSDAVYIADDGWTVRTKDGSWAAHFEHTVLISDQGAEILTRL